VNGVGVKQPPQRLRFGGTNSPDGQLGHGSIVARGAPRTAGTAVCSEATLDWLDDRAVVSMRTAQ
jgi:hypothetical protein